MPAELHRYIRFHQNEIDVVKRTIAKVEAGAGTQKDAVLEGLHATLRVHEQQLADLEQKLARRTNSPTGSP